MLADFWELMCSTSPQNNSVQNFNISNEINQGVGFVTFFYYSSARFADIDIGLAMTLEKDTIIWVVIQYFLLMAVEGVRSLLFIFWGKLDKAKDKGAVNFSTWCRNS